MGLAAAIPINSVPALFWLSMEHGNTYTASAALGTLGGTGLTVLLGAGFARIAAALHTGRAGLPASDMPRRLDGRNACLRSMAAAGAMSLLVSELSRHCGPQLCGLVAAIPVVAMFALHAGYRRGGAPLMLQVLRGYLDGMVAKAAFLGALGCAWFAGAEAWGWLIALACSACTLLAQYRLKDRVPHRQAPFRASRAPV